VSLPAVGLVCAAALQRRRAAVELPPGQLASPLIAPYRAAPIFADPCNHAAPSCAGARCPSRSPAFTMSLSLLQLPVEVVEHVVKCLSDASKHSLALALVGRPRPGDGVSEQHVRALQRLLLPAKLLLDMDDEGLSPGELPESEMGLLCTRAISPMRNLHAPPLPPSLPCCRLLRTPAPSLRWACRRAPAHQAPAHRLPALPPGWASCEGGRGAHDGAAGRGDVAELAGGGGGARGPAGHAASLQCMPQAAMQC
jgi:hypothetical protein